MSNNEINKNDRTRIGIENGAIQCKGQDIC